MLRQLIFFIGLCVVFPIASMASDQLVPIDNFVREDVYAKPRLSPDGKYLALTVRIAIKDRFVPTIMVYSLPDMKEQGAVRMPAFEVPHNYAWVTNTRLLVTKAKELGSREQPSATGEIFAMDFDGKNQEYLYGYNSHLARHVDRYGDNRGSGTLTGFPAVRNGRFLMTTHLWDSDHSFLYDVDSRNGTRKLVTSLAEPNASFVLQNNGTPRFAYSSDKDGFLVLYQYEEQNDKWNLLPDDEAKGILKPFAFTADDTEFYAFYSKSGEPQSLVKQNLKTGERVTVVHAKIGDLDLMQTGANSDIPFAIGSNVGIPSVNYLNKESTEAKLHALLSSKFPGNFVDFVNYTDDGSKLLFAAKSDKEPGAYFIFDKASNRAYPLFASREMIDPDQMAERRPFSFESRDKVKLDGYLTIPKAHDPTKKMPLIVMAHGGPHGVTDTWFYENDAQFIASRGYAVLQVNFRGSGGKGQRFQHSGYKKWGSEIQNDIIDAIHWAIKEANVDSTRMCTYGASFGGYSALMLPVREPDMFKCAVGYIGIYDLNLLFTSEEAKDRRFLAVTRRYVGQDKEILDQFSPAKHASRIKIPVFLAHGKADTRATFNHAEAMRAALIKENRPPEWMAVADEGHGFYNTKNVTEFYQRLEAFLAKHLRQ